MGCIGLAVEFSISYIPIALLAIPMNMNQQFQQVHLLVSDLMLQQPVLSLEIGLILPMASKMLTKISKFVL